MKYIRRKTLFVDVNTRTVEIKQHSQFLAHLTKLKISLCYHCLYKILAFDDNCHLYTVWFLSHDEKEHNTFPLFRESTMEMTLVSVVIG